MKFETLSFEIKEEILWIGLGVKTNKSMTTLDLETLEDLRGAILEAQDLERKGSIKGVLFHSHKPGVFLAGADISVINSLKSEAEALEALAQAHTIFNALDDLKVPTAALVDGVCLGGGLELSLACKKIFVSDNPKTALGLPEVMLGILPGFGGTYRLPKRVGLPTALDMILTGKQIKGKKLKSLGLVDAVLPAERMIELAPTYLFKKTGKKTNLKDEIQAAAMNNFLTRKIIFQKARETVLTTTKGFYPAPLKILEVLEKGAGKSRADYLTLESEAFAELCQTTQSKSLQHIFFLTDEAKKIENKDKLVKINRGAVLGAGVMGGGIAWLFAQSNQSPIMKDINSQALELGLKQASENFSKALKRKRITNDEFNRKMRSITPALTFDGFRGVDLVVEAVVENMDIKKKVLSELEDKVKDSCILTSNTSSLSIEEMSRALKHPERFAGLHFFNPVNKMPLVEIVSHETVDPNVIASLKKWALDAKKTPIVVKDGPGFLVNRILAPYLNEAAFLLAEGVSIEDLDQAALDFGMPMGPCRLMDEIGIDVCVKVGEIMHKGLGERAKPSSLSTELYALKLLGKKNAKGFYLYDEKGKSSGLNPEVASLLPQKKSYLDGLTIQMRLFLPMVNEAAYIFADRICDKAGTVDIGMIFGTGFPPFKGGLLRWADEEGLTQIAERLNNFAEQVSRERYTIAPFLSLMISDNKKFYDL